MGVDVGFFPHLHELGVSGVAQIYDAKRKMDAKQGTVNYTEQ